MTAPKTARSFHFGISFALHIEVPILMSKITCVDFCRRPFFFLPPLLPERMSLSSDGEVVHTRDTRTYQVMHPLSEGAHAISLSWLD
jgi:hypothetical protein